MIHIKFKNIAITAYMYLTFPIVIFFLTWLKLYIGVFFSAILIYALLTLLKNDYLKNEKIIKVPLIHLICISIIILIWIWISGQGGFFYQTWDHHFRNAVFRDLINFDWPVIYPKTNNGLVYYFMHWIIPAIIGKLLGWTYGNIVLLLWSYLGILLTYLLIIQFLKVNSTKKLWIVLAILITWSGLDNLGFYIINMFENYPSFATSGDGWLDYVLSYYPYGYQYSSNDTLISWVFNQTISPWIIIILIIENRNLKNYAFLSLLMLPYAPLPFIGILFILLVLSIPDYKTMFINKDYKSLLTKTFSIPNIASLLTIFPVFLLFYSCNENISEGKVPITMYVPLEAYNLKRISILILFYFIEFGVYMILIFSTFKKNILYYAILLSLIIIPIFKIDVGRDFCMRASIPALFILMIMILKFILEADKKSNNIKISYNILILLLVIASLNPFMEYLDRCMQFYYTKTFPIVSDEIKTFSDKSVFDSNIDFTYNFLTSDPKRKTFYKYLAK